MEIRDNSSKQIRLKKDYLYDVECGHNRKLECQRYYGSYRIGNFICSRLGFTKESIEKVEKNIDIIKRVVARQGLILDTNQYLEEDSYALSLLTISESELLLRLSILDILSLSSDVLLLKPKIIVFYSPEQLYNAVNKIRKSNSKPTVKVLSEILSGEYSYKEEKETNKVTIKAAKKKLLIEFYKRDLYKDDLTLQLDEK